MRKPIFVGDITQLGVWYWIELEGYEKLVRKPSGAFAFAESEIMGWGCETISEIFVRQKEANYAPRMRLWEGDDEPTTKERSSGKWKNNWRAWGPEMSTIIKDLKRYDEFCETGRTQWPEEG